MLSVHLLGSFCLLGSLRLFSQWLKLLLPNIISFTLGFPNLQLYLLGQIKSVQDVLALL